MWEFTVEETINAPMEVVFKLITDLPNYQNWNPFLIKASGVVKVGGVVSGKSNLGWVTTPYRHRIFDYAPNQSFGYRDFGLLALFVCSERSRHLETVDGKTHFRCYLKISRPLSGLLNILFGKGLRDGMVAETNALKFEAEKMSSYKVEKGNN
jgi:hypothetical protein